MRFVLILFFSGKSKQGQNGEYVVCIVSHPFYKSPKLLTGDTTYIIFHWLPADICFELLISFAQPSLLSMTTLKLKLL